MSKNIKWIVVFIVAVFILGSSYLVINKNDLFKGDISSFQFGNISNNQMVDQRLNFFNVNNLSTIRPTALSRPAYGLKKPPLKIGSKQYEGDGTYKIYKGDRAVSNNGVTIEANNFISLFSPPYKKRDTSLMIVGIQYYIGDHQLYYLDTPISINNYSAQKNPEYHRLSDNGITIQLIEFDEQNFEWVALKITSDTNYKISSAKDLYDICRKQNNLNNPKNGGSHKECLDYNAYSKNLPNEQERESENFIFIYPKEIESIVRNYYIPQTEACYRTIKEKFGPGIDLVYKKFPIHLFEDIDQRQYLNGDGKAFFWPYDKDKITKISHYKVDPDCANYEVLPHEILHIFMNNIGFPNHFIHEGLANYVSSELNKEDEAKVKTLAKNITLKLFDEPYYVKSEKIYIQHIMGGSNKYYKDFYVGKKYPVNNLNKLNIATTIGLASSEIEDISNQERIIIKLNSQNDNEQTVNIDIYKGKLPIEKTTCEKTYFVKEGYWIDESNNKINYIKPTKETYSDYTSNDQTSNYTTGECFWYEIKNRYGESGVKKLIKMLHDSRDKPGTYYNFPTQIKDALKINISEINLILNKFNLSKALIYGAFTGSNSGQRLKY